MSLEARSVRSTLDWVYALGEAEVGRPLRVGIERQGERRELILTLGKRTGIPRDVAVWGRMARALLALSLAIVIAYSKPYDLQARVGALLLAEVGIFSLFFLNAHIAGMNALENQLPLFLARARTSPAGIARRRVVVCLCGDFPTAVVPRLVGVGPDLDSATRDHVHPRLLPHLSSE